MILARVRVEFIKPLPPEIHVDLTPGEQVVGMELTGGGLNVYIAEHIDWESNAATNLRAT